jgi:hypothetical protein
MWEVNIKMYVKATVYESVDWIDVAEDREEWWDLTNVVMYRVIP